MAAAWGAAWKTAATMRMAKVSLALAVCLKDGSFSIWKGPIMDNTGKELVAKDVVVDDKFLGGLKTYVKGVEGKVPGN